MLCCRSLTEIFQYLRYYYLSIILRLRRTYSYVFACTKNPVGSTWFNRKKKKRKRKGKKKKNTTKNATRSQSSRKGHGRIQQPTINPAPGTYPTGWDWPQPGCASVLMLARPISNSCVLHVVHSGTTIQTHGGITISYPSHSRHGLCLCVSDCYSSVCDIRASEVSPSTQIDKMNFMWIRKAPHT